MSKSADIAAAVAARIETIRTANGYATEIGVRVYRGRRKIDEGHLPCAVIVEGDDEVPDMREGSTQAKIRQPFIIEGHTDCDPDNPNDAAHAIVADIKRAIFSGDLTLGGLTRSAVRYAGRSIAPREDGLSIVSAAVEISIEFVEELAQP